MMLAGTVLGGAYLAKAAGIASSDESVDEEFAAAKRATSAFYFAHVLPRAHGYLAAMAADPGITMAIPAEAFAD